MIILVILICTMLILFDFIRLIRDAEYVVTDSFSWFGILYTDA